MKIYYILLLSGVFLLTMVRCSLAQDNNYRQSPARVNDLVHTKLDVRFDYKKRYLYGREWVTIKPHFYPTDSLRLDAKGMDIHTIGILAGGKLSPLKFTYDSLSLAIRLNRTYNRSETYTVFIDYTAKPNERKGLRNNEKGLYFINPDGTEKNKPIEIWTEGEPESSSGWFPTIDKPNQKTTSEISMTVQAKYVTLSNGRLASQKKNNDGTRTDTWKMELPNSPYLFMMAVGDFKIYHDHWHGKEVNYYLEPQYAPYARDMFGDVPEAISLFSKITGVDYPWNKYAAIVVRDYVSGAMENTTANVFGSQSTRRELLDQYYNSGVEHELFHQWFGDYVTCESWSNITLNESFADLGEILWLEHKYGKDAADEHLHNGLQGYLSNPDNAKIPLVNFHYQAIHDAFNGVTYQKGGRILNMLRNYLGNEAFYRGLNIYLTSNAFKSAEAQQLRLAMEQACGLDLNWFFNQWYYNAGHPVLDISYHWDETAKTEYVYIAQKQDGQVFKLPIAIDIYINGKTERHKIWLNAKADTLSLKLIAKPTLVNVDADKVLVAQKTDHKTLEQFVFQYFNAPLYLDRYEALEVSGNNQGDKGAQKVIFAALNDKFSGLRLKALETLASDKKDFMTLDKDLKDTTLPRVMELAKNDDNTLVKTYALRILGSLKNLKYMEIFKKAISSPSYQVDAAGLIGINEVDPVAALKFAVRFEDDNIGDLTQAIVRVYAASGGDAKWPYVYQRYVNGTLQEQIHLTEKFSRMIESLKNPEYVRQGIAELKYMGITYKKDGAAPYIIKYLKAVKEARDKTNDITASKDITEAMKLIENAK
ncbi:MULTISPECIES: M1 family metallopeptidase [Mucilaginibacter]|uniref:Aminopeptidase N n=2 Tax=Mucilaginibacter rubeus TaxID=2027860 RepID=A0ABX7U6R5_9SPHI|nr:MULTISPECIES: M1 family metallopeptidase [Mucilaginibacter]QTE41012.1 M1 family metallopeptidase [Mucilaginibacter rubeus]QTE47615.1 M1 family metallopeptidase [Mucilaginibacter rubeus]QTE59006.1 M1 family metallopeptidase [Mucilaginibacter rubeus]QTE61533.1 M1 family metallopeptidase [Mucilaginibacter rubeus]QTF60291.1 M1 family metallopeptidase [Mucilaginibacter rubeus]